MHTDAHVNIHSCSFPNQPATDDGGYFNSLSVWFYIGVCGYVLTLLLHTYPNPFWRSSWRVSVRRRVVRIHSNNNHPGSWSSYTHSPTHTYMTTNELHNSSQHTGYKCTQSLLLKNKINITRITICWNHLLWQSGQISQRAHSAWWPILWENNRWLSEWNPQCLHKGCWNREERERM